MGLVVLGGVLIGGEGEVWGCLWGSYGGLCLLGIVVCYFGDVISVFFVLYFIFFVWVRYVGLCFCLFRFLVFHKGRKSEAKRGRVTFVFISCARP